MDAQHDRAVRLRPTDYWRLMALIGDVRVVELECRLAAERAKVRMEAALAAKARLAAQLASSYDGFDPDADYLTDDAACTLIRKADL